MEHTDQHLSVVVQSFSISGRGTAIVLGDLLGRIKSKDWVKVQMKDGQCAEIQVDSIEFADQRSERKANVVLMVTGVRPEDIAIDVPITGKTVNQNFDHSTSC